MLAALAEIFGGVVLPALALVALGVVLQRSRALDINTLAKLNLYAVVPGFLLVRMAESQFAWSTLGLVGVGVLAPMLVLGLGVWPVFARLGLDGRARTAAIAGALFYNAGNFGIPVAQLAFGDAGGEIQALVVLFLNTAVFFVGYLMLATKDGGVRGALRSYLRLPMFYVIVIGLALRASGLVSPGPPRWLSWLWTAAHFLADAMVPLALLTLGAQIASKPVWPRWRFTGPVLVVKLIGLPAVTAVFVFWLGLWPWPGAQLVLAAAGPTAVNTLLLTMEVKGDVESMAGAVFFTTLLCALTVTPLLLLLRALGGAALPTP